jgi:CPA1 family monovalent cation:H+ antiporter
MTLFLPPLIYASTVRVSWHLLRFTFFPGVILGVASAVAVIAAVAFAAKTLFLPGIGWAAALLIGLVAALWDTRLFHEAEGRPRVPRAIADTLKARELVGRIVILGTLGVVEDALTSSPSVAETVRDNFLFAVPAGIVAGLIIGRLAVWLRQRIDPAPVEIAVSVATPYVAALVAEAAGISAAAAIITSALVVSAIRVDRGSGATISSTEARINATAFWEVASLMVSGVLFILAGRAVPEALRALQLWPIWQVSLTAAALLGIALTVQLCFSYAGARMMPISAALQPAGRVPVAALTAATVMTWSSTRSVIGLVIALSVPASLPDGTAFRERDLILALGTLLVIGSVLLQGLTLRPLVEWAALADPREHEEEEQHARQAMREAAQAPAEENADSFDAARQELMRLREQDRIGDETMVGMMRETDLTARAAENEPLPGAGPPQP